MTCGNGGGAKPPEAPIDPTERWQSYLAKCGEIEKAFREILSLSDDAHLRRLGRRYAMAAMPSPKRQAWPPKGPTDQAVRRELERIERGARAVLAGRKGSREQLRKAICDASRFVQSVALIGSLILAARLPGAPRESIEQLANDAAALAATIPRSKHPGGRQPAKTDETALAILLAQDFEALTGEEATVNNRDLDKNSPYDSSPFMLLIECVFATVGLPGSPRKAAERAVAHLAAARSRTGKTANE